MAGGPGILRGGCATGTFTNDLTAHMLAPWARALQRRPGMRVSTLVLWATTIGILVPRPVQAGAERPVFVTVTGQTAIGFRLAVGRTAPCDSTENRMMFDGTLPPGQHTFETGSEVVCYRYTSAAFPTAEWSVRASCRPGYAMAGR